MKIGRVIDNVWSTRKDPALVGLKLMIVQLLDKPGNTEGKVIVAVDIIGAGIGEKVLVSEGSSSKQMGGLENSPIDATIVGIIDEKESQ